jgi:hypothetical protein
MIRNISGIGARSLLRSLAKLGGHQSTQGLQLTQLWGLGPSLKRGVARSASAVNGEGAKAD